MRSCRTRLVYRRVVRAAILILLVQAPPPDAAGEQLRGRVEEARMELERGRAEAALRLLELAPPSVEMYRLRITARVALGRLEQAVGDYSRLVQLQRQDDPGVLQQIAVGVLNGISHSVDPLLGAAACEALLAVNHADCLKRLRREASGFQITAPRLAAAAALVRHGDQTFAAAFTSAAAVADGHALLLLADAARSLPPESAVPVLATLLARGGPDVQYLAAAGLGRMKTPESHAALVSFVHSRPPSPARASAWISLAELGNPEALQQVAEALPLLDGSDLVAAARALHNTNDERGTRALRRIADGQDQMLRLDAAAALATKEPQYGQRLIDVGLRAPNPWVRAHALSVLRTLGSRVAEPHQRMMLDPDGWVRLRAAELVLSAARSGRRSPGHSGRE